MKVTKVVFTILDAEIISVPNGVNKEESKKILEEEVKDFRKTVFVIGEKPILETALELLLIDIEEDDEIKNSFDFKDENHLYIITENSRKGVSRVKLGVEY